MRIEEKASRLFFECFVTFVVNHTIHPISRLDP